MELYDMNVQKIIKVKQKRYVLANWGISNPVNPKLLNIVRKFECEERRDFIEDKLCRLEITDRGGSVVRYIFEDEAEDDKIIQLASQLHRRLTIELFYKCALCRREEPDRVPETSTPGDEIVVYFACTSQQGFFEYKAP